MYKNTKKYINKIQDNFRLQLLTCGILSFIVIIIFILANRILDLKKSKEYKITDKPELINSIEYVSTDDNIVTIKGYAFLLDKDSYNNSISLLLRNVKNMQEIWFNMEQNNRSDVSQYFDGEYYYGNSGFIATKKKSKINPDDVYEIVIIIDFTNETGQKNRISVSTFRYLFNYKLYAFNPNDFVQPDLNNESNLLKEVFSKGRLCFYEKDYGMYLYQYSGKLYWIATKDFNFQENGSTYIPYHLYTSQVDKLPGDRIKYNFDNLDFIFEQYEYKDENTTPYRVAIRDLPTTYPITYIKTGLYDNENKVWIWTKCFQLDNISNLE